MKGQLAGRLLDYGSPLPDRADGRAVVGIMAVPFMKGQLAWRLLDLWASPS